MNVHQVVSPIATSPPKTADRHAFVGGHLRSRWYVLDPCSIGAASDDRCRLEFTEFRRHKSTDNPLHIIGFLSQWKHYLDSLEKGELDRGRTLDMEKLEKVRSTTM